MNKLILFFVFIIPTLSCSKGIPQITQNEKIERKIKDEIDMLDKRIIESFIKGDPSIVKELSSKKMIEEGQGDIAELVYEASADLKNGEYKILDQYYIKNPTTRSNITISSARNDLNDYTFKFEATTKQLFISLLIANGNISTSDPLITIVYGKDKEGWRIYMLNVGFYRINGKTSPELFAQAKAEYNRGDLLNAANDAELAITTLIPAGKYLTYENAMEIEQFDETVHKERDAKYHFPLTVTQIPTAPQIYNVYPQAHKRGYFTCIEYVTVLDLKDTAKTNAENILLHQMISEILPDIKTDEERTLYSAWNEFPDGDKKRYGYKFIRKNN